MDALILWLLLLKVRITAMATTQGVSLAFMSALFICVLQGAGGATFEIQNNCSFTVWAAGSPGGGERLESGQLWTIQVPNDTSGARVWGRTGCSFNANGRGSCNTGDCGGLLNCQGFGSTPATMVEYSLNQYQNNDFYDISVVDGFNLPMSIIPSNPSCNAVACSRNISAICPAELRVSGGCDSPCTRFNTSQYCCTGEYSNNCNSNNYSRIFKRQCPQAISYATDDANSTFTCPGSTDYKVVFCGGTLTSVQGQNFTVGSPNMTLTPYGSPTTSPTMAPRATNLSHPLTPLPGNSTHPSRKKTSKKMVILLGSIVGSTALFVMLCLVFGCCVRQWKTSVRTDNNIDARGNFGEVYFDYKILRDATGNFDRKNMLGKGGFGEVYKGRLPDGRDVAVKKLNGKHTTQAAEEFLTEVKLISSVRHRNLVCLLGCCRRGHKRLLVYEFMSNTSLDKHLFGEIRNPLRWESRLNIIVGTARGLAYLHGESDVRIIHRDIKCANILLDDNLHPKIADFGLARFFPESQTHVSTRVGGTIGYTAPEYAVHGQLTEKADIYSYGIVVLEIVSERKCVDARQPASRQLLLEWAWNQFEQNEVLDIVDPLLEGEGQYPREEVLRVVTIALLCTQGSWTQRPPMSQVVSMLTNNSQRIYEPTRPAFIDVATDRSANFLPYRNLRPNLALLQLGHLTDLSASHYFPAKRNGVYLFTICLFCC